MIREILIVDDEPLIVEMLCSALKSDGVKLTGFSRAEDALKYASENPVDVVITDILMPGMTGTELFFKLREKDCFAQIIIITGVPTRDNLTKMLKGGANDFIIKPISIEKLKRIVNEALARYDRWEEATKQWIELEGAQ
ncbi:MAG: response regulator [Candidatus Omnitrophota bacterium]